MLEFQNIKTFLLKDMLQIGQICSKLVRYAPNMLQVLVVSKFKNTVPWTYVVNDLSAEEITGIFYEKELQKTNQEKFRIEKVLNRKGDKLYVK